ncbi:N5-glutamine S-adenosyl-L-methionine-dependent methyltransferase [Mycoplasma haemocanis str. Illinois]|uniref:peptide chain release factor N(5)-glutamine methyltransferase n=1 Tax=Mycoplasma haemocanis (strain Illinois) TaxID=1111676 RepID=H6N8I4_MYCHN|nr:class I SAM-dependent methyltransferase [Mycoplasma haemocanis]AEW45956.1 N5-glutamine S-adenosyl-L-methionine-dependent methyltransferase [Mycoplasma haemocanis str. Illinois]
MTKRVTFKQIVEKKNFQINAYKLVYFLSSKVKNINDYQKYKSTKIDFDEAYFDECYERLSDSNNTIERICKKVFFHKHEFILNDGVFCPRNETELIVEYLNQEIKEDPSLKKSSYVDLCSGTGVIGISIALQNEGFFKKISLVDISEEAVKNIKENCTKYNLKLSVVKQDWYEYLQENGADVITANFPYVSKEDDIDEHIMESEPDWALFAENDGWEHYDKILKFMDRNKAWKLIVLECSAYHEKKWKSIKNTYPNVKWKFLYDLNGKLRVVSLKR